MDWTIIKVKYCLYSNFSDRLLASLVRLLALTAQIECYPNELQMLKVCTKKS